MPESSDQNTFQSSLHARLLNGDRLASEELVRLILPALAEELERQFPRVDTHLVHDGVIDAILDYSTNPQQFDVKKSVPLDRFLATNAWRNVANLSRGEKRRKNREVLVGRKKAEADVALDPAAGNIQREEQEAVEARTAAMLAALDTPVDKEILSLRLQGEKSTAEFARVLKVTHLPLKEQRVEVKRHKDRITRYLRRKGLLP